MRCETYDGSHAISKTGCLKKKASEQVGSIFLTGHSLRQAVVPLQSRAESTKARTKGIVFKKAGFGGCSDGSGISHERACRSLKVTRHLEIDSMSLDGDTINNRTYWLASSIRVYTIIASTSPRLSNTFVFAGSPEALYAAYAGNLLRGRRWRNPTLFARFFRFTDSSHSQVEKTIVN